MIGMLEKLFLHRYLTFDQNKVYLFGNSMTLFPARLIASMTKSVHDGGDPSQLYRFSRAEGYSWFNQMVRDYHLNPKDIIDWGTDLLSLAGYGKVTNEEINFKDKKIVFTLTESSVAREYLKLFNKPDHAVCDVIRGLVAGGSRIIYNDETMDAVERECEALGAPKCVFHLKRRSEFDLSDPEVLRQLGKEV
jgi:hypothetical protein